MRAHETPFSLLRFIAAAICGNLAISAYLSVTLPLLHVATPELLFQWDASNLIGDAAFSGGLRTALLGFGLDFCVSAVWSAIFGVLFCRFWLVRRTPLASGAVFGVFVMVCMIFLVVPLGAARQSATHLDIVLLNKLVAHVAFFGVPLAAVWAWGERTAL